jgi:hypothetical protein
MPDALPRRKLRHGPIKALPRHDGYPPTDVHRAADQLLNAGELVVSNRDSETSAHGECIRQDWF